MVYLLPIPIALFLAICWAAWVSRPPRPAPPAQSVAEYRRTLAALAPDRGRRDAVPAQRSKPEQRHLAHSR